VKRVCGPTQRYLAIAVMIEHIVAEGLLAHCYRKMLVAKAERIESSAFDKIDGLKRLESGSRECNEIGIAPKPLQTPHPPLYGGFTHSMRTALFWAQYAGKPIVLASDLQFCKNLWRAYNEEAAK